MLGVTLHWEGKAGLTRWGSRRGLVESSAAPLRFAEPAAEFRIVSRALWGLSFPPPMCPRLAVSLGPILNPNRFPSDPGSWSRGFI